MLSLLFIYKSPHRHIAMSGIAEIERQKIADCVKNALTGYTFACLKALKNIRVLARFSELKKLCDILYYYFCLVSTTMQTLGGQRPISNFEFHCL